MAEDVKAATTRVYVVLCKPNEVVENEDREDGEPGREIVTIHGGWSMAGEYDAANPTAACKLAKAANGGQPRDAQWVGVPKRNWHPITPTVKTVEQESWS